LDFGRLRKSPVVALWPAATARRGSFWLAVSLG
jgi:hypothetical protein